MTKSMRVMSAVVLTWLCLTNAFALDTLLEERFEGADQGAPPKGWLVNNPPYFYSAGYCVVTNNVGGANGNCITLVNTNSELRAGGAALYAKSWALAVKTVNVTAYLNKPVEVSFRVRFAQNDALMAAWLGSPETCILAGIYFRGDGQMGVITKQKEVRTFGTYQSNIWYQVKIKTVPTSNSYAADVSANGRVIASVENIPFVEDGKDIKTIYLQNFGYIDGPSEACFADISITSR